MYRHNVIAIREAGRQRQPHSSPRRAAVYDPFTPPEWVRGGQSILSPRRAGLRGPDLAPGEITINRFNNTSQKEKVAKRKKITTIILCLLDIAYTMRATRRSDPSASIAASASGRYPLWCRPLITHICCCPQCDKSVLFMVLAGKLTLK